MSTLTPGIAVTPTREFPQVFHLRLPCGKSDSRPGEALVPSTSTNAASFSPLRRAETARLHADLQAIMERSRDLVWLSGRLVARARARPHIAGSSDGGDSVSRTIMEKIASGVLPAETPVRMWAGLGRGRPCNACGNLVTVTEVEHELDFARGRTVRFHDACSETWRRAISGATSSIGRRPGTRAISGGAADGSTTTPVRTGVTAAIAVVRYLAQHRGQAFCTKCLSAQLFGGRDIDVVMRRSEGHGVQRLHDQCSVCSQRRLVAALPRGREMTSG